MTFLFERNQKVRIDGATWILRRMVSEECWQLENPSNGRIIERDRKQLREMWRKRELVPVMEEDREPTKLTTIGVPQDAQQIINLRLAYVKAVEHLPVNKKDYETAIEEVRKELSKIAALTEPPCSPYAQKLTKVWHWTTVYRWHTRHEEGARDSHALLHKKRIRKLNVDARVVEILEDALETVYFTPERPTLKDALDHAVEMVKEENKMRRSLGLEAFPMPISLWQHKKFKENEETSNPDGWKKAKERIRKYFQEECLLKKARRLRNRGRHRESVSAKVAPSNGNSGNGNPEPQVKVPTAASRPNDSAKTPVEIPVFVPIIQERNRNGQLEDSPAGIDVDRPAPPANITSNHPHSEPLAS